MSKILAELHLMNRIYEVREQFRRLNLGRLFWNNKQQENKMVGNLDIPSLNELKVSREISGRYSHVTEREFVLLAIIFALIKTFAADTRTVFVDKFLTELFTDNGAIFETTELDNGFIVTAQNKVRW